MMSALMRSIKAYSTLLLFYLATFTTAIHAQAAQDLMLLNPASPDPLLEDTTPSIAKTAQDLMLTNHTSPDPLLEDTTPSIANFCKYPPRIPYGKLREEYMEKNEFTKDAKVMYTCQLGYIRVPGTSQTIICLDNNTWSIPDVFCKRRSCGNPGEVANAEMEADDFLFGSRVTFVCNQGYKMIAKYNYRDCLSNGIWSNVLPECEAVLCPSPPTITNGFFYHEKDEYTYLDSVTYDCNGTLSLIGEKSLACNEKGEWSPNAPQCRAIECPNPSVPQANKLSGILGPYYLNSAVKFACSKGYVLNGSDTVKCNQNSQWEPELPRCTAITCGNPGPIPNGYMFHGGFLFDATIYYRCDKGYRMKYISSRRCQLNGSWTLPIPECKVITCGAPPNSVNTEVEAKNFSFGSEAIYKCIKGYKMVSQTNSRKCTENGYWSGRIPDCKVITCGAPPNSGNTEVEAKNFAFGSEAIYKCKKGYKMVSQTNSMKCTENGYWSGSIPDCKVITCGAPPNSVNTEVEAKDFSFGMEAIYNCKKGYKMVSQTNSMKCTENGYWSGSIPDCKAQPCPPPEDLLGGSYSPKKEKYGYQESVTYECNELRLIGEHSVYCTDDGNWTSGAPECEARSCGNPGDIDHGTMEYENFLFGSRVNYTCDPGYTMESRNNSRECQTNGTWSGTDPVCKESVCDKIWELQEEARQCTSTPDDWIKYLQVQYLYLQIENLKLDIKIKKKKMVVT